ncbi:MAG: hypothetical protein M3Y21_02125 [Candidatus Eremiobacteraeota bacterium]|nr:hypothetical protein [Candidatus Eremiobacteraeota bacterium]
MLHKTAAVALLIAGLVGCGGGNASSSSGSSGQQATADNVTEAMFKNDRDSVVANFDSSLHNKVTRAEVGTLSDKMHQLGDYKGLTPLASDLTKSEFSYTANFTKGAARVVMKLDADGKIGAYRVFFNK